MKLRGKYPRPPGELHLRLETAFGINLRGLKVRRPCSLLTLLVLPLGNWWREVFGPSYRPGPETRQTPCST